MKNNATSGPVFSLYLSIVLLLVLVSVSGNVYAKHSLFATPLPPMKNTEVLQDGRQRRKNRYFPHNFKFGGCSTFGHSCFGGHGKRFDSTVQRDTLQESISQNFQESKVPSPNDELFYVLPNDEFRERSDQPFMRTRKDAQQFGPYPLSSLVDQWIASHRRSHRTETDITNK